MTHARGVIRALAAPSAIWVAFGCGLAVRTNQPLIVLVIVAVIPLALVWSIALLGVKLREMTGGDEASSSSTTPAHVPPQRAAGSTTSGRSTGRDIGPGYDRFLMIYCGTGVIVMLLVGAGISFSNRHSPDQPQDLLIDAPAGATLLGYQLGSRLNLPECPTKLSADRQIVYGESISAACFKHLDPARAGTPPGRSELLAVERLDIARHYADVNWVRPVCVAVVDGRIAAVAVHIGDMWAHVTRTSELLGASTTSRTWSIDNGKIMRLYASRLWKMPNFRFEIVSERRLAEQSRGSRAEYAVAIASSNGAEDVFANAQTSLDSDCPSIARDELDAGT
jgi:hypothetical protein